MSFSEDFLHYIWQFRLFSLIDLKTTSGEPIEILSVGLHNKNAGPDFENAKIRIGSNLWAGNLEIHIRSSDWGRHNHSTDLAYDNVILHVVFQHDEEVYRTDGTIIQTLVLDERISPDVQFRYQDLMQNMNWIACEHRIKSVDGFYIQNWLSRVLIERLEDKSKLVDQLLEEYKGSWDDAFYVMLARNFGFKTNALPFELLARSIPQQILGKHKDNHLQIEALIFGQAGFISSGLTDEYPRLLENEYKFLKLKYKLTPIDQFIWKFSRLRPQNFPTVRLAQFAALVIKSNHLFSKILEINDVTVLKKFFDELPIHRYWENHYRFDKETSKAQTQLGKDSIYTILLNTVAIFLFSYGKRTDKQYFISRAISLIESLPFETNQITTRYTEIGIEHGRADMSQALLQLKKEYCDQKKCLHCGIGVKLLNQL